MKQLINLNCVHKTHGSVHTFLVCSSVTPTVLRSGVKDMLLPLRPIDDSLYAILELLWIRYFQLMDDRFNVNYVFIIADCERG